MKPSTLVTSVLSLAVASLSLTAMAQDPRDFGPRYGTNYNSAPNRTFLGLPLPQQWSGGRPTGLSRAGNGQDYFPTGSSANCPNGQCATGRSAYGSRSSAGCPNGVCPTGACVNGQCSTGACANGQCQTGACANGQCTTGRCPNGNCGPDPFMNRNNTNPQATQSGWSPRSSRSTQANPAGRFSEAADADRWVPRSGIDPLDEAFNSRYRRDDLELKSEYFGGDSREQQDTLRAPIPSRSRANSDYRTQPSRRSMEAPAESLSGVARF